MSPVLLASTSGMAMTSQASLPLAITSPVAARRIQRCLQTAAKRAPPTASLAPRRRPTAPRFGRAPARAAQALESDRSSTSADADTPNTPEQAQQEQPSTSGTGSSSSGGGNTKLIASLSVAGGLLALVLGGVLLKDQIRAFLTLFIDLVDDWGALGYLAYMVVYAALELLAVPAIPLTMTAGVIFGVGPGTAVVSVAATAAAAGAFLIARYVARDRVAAWAASNPKFAAIDKAIGKDGFRVVTLLRLSPLLPLAASNYLYGLTSVDLGSYVLASWLGMLPGTLAYVAAGTYGKDLILGGAAAAGGHGSLLQPWQVALGVGVSGVAVWYVGRLATKALAEMDDGMKED